MVIYVSSGYMVLVYIACAKCCLAHGWQSRQWTLIAPTGENVKGMEAGADEHAPRLVGETSQLRVLTVRLIRGTRLRRPIS